MTKKNKTFFKVKSDEPTKIKIEKFMVYTCDIFNHALRICMKLKLYLKILLLFNRKGIRKNMFILSSVKLKQVILTTRTLKT